MHVLGFTTSRDLAVAADVPESVISRWRTLGRQPSIEQLRRLRGPLQAPMLELLVAAGYLTAEEAALRDRPQPARAFRSTEDAIRADTQLTDDLRHLLLTQYRATVAVARARSAEAEPE